MSHSLVGCGVNVMGHDQHFKNSNSNVSKRTHVAEMSPVFGTRLVVLLTPAGLPGARQQSEHSLPVISQNPHSTQGCSYAIVSPVSPLSERRRGEAETGVWAVPPGTGQGRPRPRQPVAGVQALCDTHMRVLLCVCTCPHVCLSSDVGHCLHLF